MRHRSIKGQPGVVTEMGFGLDAIGIGKGLSCFQVGQESRKHLNVDGNKSGIESFRRYALEEALALRGIWIDGVCRSERANVFLRIGLCRADDRCAGNTCEPHCQGTNPAACAKHEYGLTTAHFQEFEPGESSQGDA